jgi:hypothetical protein
MSLGYLSIVREESGAARAAPEPKLRGQPQPSLKGRNYGRRAELAKRLDGRMRIVADRTREVLIQGIQRVGLELSEGPAQLLLDPVYNVEKRAPISL